MTNRMHSSQNDLERAFLAFNQHSLQLETAYRALQIRVSQLGSELAAVRSDRNREQAECSGGGGMLPISRPDTSSAIAVERIEEHRKAGGGRLVTACSQSLRRFRASGEHAEDLITLVAQALSGPGGS